MTGSAAINGGESFLDKKSKGYHSVGKSVIHAGVESVKSAGLVEGAMAGAKVWAFMPGGAAVGAGAGFLIGGANKLWDLVPAKSKLSKKNVFSKVEKGSDKVYDKFIKKPLRKVKNPMLRKVMKYA